MYLVHLHLRSTDPRRPSLPEAAADWMRAAAAPQDRVEHVSAHPWAQPDPVLGVYLIADRLQDAEQRAAAVCCRALASRPELRGWALIEGQVPLIAPLHEGFLCDSAGAGRNRPSPLPSN